MLRTIDLPTALTVIKAIAAADGVLKGGDGYLTKLEMIMLCKRWLELRRVAEPAHHVHKRAATVGATRESKGHGR